ncbi:MAG: hypothetical protein ACQUHE_15725, partial [Bacteroidia bacterium]
PCDSVVVDCAGVAGGSAYINPNCGTCIGGTTGFTECPPEIRDRLYQYPCAKRLVSQLSTFKGDIASLIKSTFGKNDQIDIVFKVDNSLIGTSTPVNLAIWALNALNISLRYAINHD